MYQLKMDQTTSRYIDDTECVELSLPTRQCLGMVTLPVHSVAEVESDILYQINHPIAAPSLPELVRKTGASSACILISDATRNVPTAQIAPILVDQLISAGMALENILFIVAIGVHRPATDAEMRSMVGPSLWGKVMVENHTPFDPDNLIHLGTTSRGTPVSVNKRAYECDLHISIGKVEPHEFAGFSGGRKSVLPGVASAETIIANHSPAMLASPYAVPGKLEGNPVHEDMLETAKRFGIDFCVCTVLNGENHLAGVFAGELESAHEAAVSYLQKTCRVMLQKPDVVVTTPGVPLNIDFYQSLKPLIALTELLDDHTVVALYCACPEGVNSTDLLRPFLATKSLDDVLAYVNENYEIQMDHALLLTKILKKNVKIVVYSPNLESDILKSMHLIPAENYQDMLDKACALTGKSDPSVLFYPEAQRTLPYTSP